MLKVRYVGLKDKETDCVAGTGITWVGKGDVKEVPDKAWNLMKNHPDVWELIEAPAAASPVDDDRFKVVVDSFGQREVVDLSAMDDDALKAFVDSHNLDVSKKKRGDGLRTAIVMSVKNVQPEPNPATQDSQGE